MKLTFEDISIAGIACASPYQRLDLKLLSNEQGDIEVNRIIESASLCSAHLADKPANINDVCITTARRLLKAININANEIDAIVFVSQTSDAMMSTTSTIIQFNPGMIINVATRDNNDGAASYIYGLYQAAMLISAGGCNHILVCTGDATSQLLHPKNGQVRMVFGNAASSTLIERGNG